MKITVVTQYFWPESFIINDLVRCLAELDNEVTVLTGKPNYPDGEIYSGYQSKGISDELYMDSVRVFRVPLRPRHQASSRQLILNYLSFIWSGLRHFPRLTLNQPADVILVFAPSPILSAIPAIHLKNRKSCPVVLWVQDLWPESLADSGFIQNKGLLWLCKQIVRSIYKRCDRLLIPSEGFRDPINRLAAPEKVFYYPNSFADFSLVSKTCSLPLDISLVFDQFFTVMFAGNFGHAQSLETIVYAAKILKKSPEIKIMMVGSGHRSEWLKTEIEALQLGNVLLAGRYAMDEMPSLYARADILLLTLRDTEAFARTIPSKLQAYMAAGKPVVAAVSGVSADIINSAGGGQVVAAEDHVALADAIFSLYRLTSNQREVLGEKSRQYYLDNFEMSQQAKRLIELLQEVTKIS